MTTDHLLPDNPELDEALADFADHLLGDQTEQRTMSETTYPTEIQALQETVTRLHQALGNPEPDPAMAERVKANLIAEWNRLHPAEQKARQTAKSSPSVFEQLESFIRQNQRSLSTVALVAAAALFLLVAFLPGGLGGVALPGASGGGDSGEQVSTLLSNPVGAVVIMVVCGGLLYLLIRKDK